MDFRVGREGTFVLDKNVLGFQVAVADVERVEVSHARYNGVEATPGLLLAEARWKAVDEVVHEVPAFHELLDEVDVSFPGHPGHEDLINAEALRMVYLLKDQDLVHLALGGARVARAGDFLITGEGGLAESQISAHHSSDDEMSGTRVVERKQH